MNSEEVHCRKNKLYRGFWSHRGIYQLSSPLTHIPVDDTGINECVRFGGEEKLSEINTRKISPTLSLPLQTPSSIVSWPSPCGSYTFNNNSGMFASDFFRLIKTSMRSKVSTICVFTFNCTYNLKGNLFTSHW